MGAVRLAERPAAEGPVVTALCPRCQTTRRPREVICAYCGFDIRDLVSPRFDDQVLGALFLGDPEVMEEAAFLLGLRRPPGAGPALERRYRETGNPFVQREIVIAIDQVGGREADRVLADARTHYSVVVRGEALRRLVRRGGQEGEEAAAAARADPSPHVRLMAFRPPTSSEILASGGW